MEIDDPKPVQIKPKKKKKPIMKLKIPEEHTTPMDSGMGVNEEEKASDSIQSTGSYQHVNIDKEQIEIDEEMTKYAQQVHNDKFKLSKKFTDPAGTLESNGDASMTSNSLCNRIAESSLGSGTMSFEDIQKTVMRIGIDDNLEEELQAEVGEDDALFKDPDVSINLNDLK
jgi:hypothetical protein